MSCPNCDHSMYRVAESIYWCPRCGTLSPNHEAPEAPMLVHRCRDFERMSFRERIGNPPLALWRRLGLAESINRPEDRP